MAKRTRNKVLDGLQLTVGAVFLSVVLHLSLAEAPLGVHTEIPDALVGGLHESVLHLGGEMPWSWIKICFSGTLTI